MPVSLHLPTSSFSTADFAREGSEHLITILDRSPDPPAVDAASSDYNKIIRQDYADPFYAKLACGAMTLWRTPEFSANFFESGVVVLAKETDPQAKYVRESLEVNLREDMRSEGRKAYGLKGGSEVKGQYRGVDTAPLEGNIACTQSLFHLHPAVGCLPFLCGKT